MRDNPQREFLRHAVDVPLEVDRVGLSVPSKGKGINVSQGGLAFLSTVCPEVGDILHLRIPTVTPAFEARARVAWCRREAGKFLVGVQFLEAGTAFKSRMVQQVCAIEKYRKDVLRDEGRELTPQDAAAEWIARFGGRFPDQPTMPTDDSVA